MLFACSRGGQVLISNGDGLSRISNSELAIRCRWLKAVAL